MRSPRVIVLLLGVLAAVIVLRRQRASRGEHVDLYYEDGSMVSLEDGAGDAERLLAVARDALRH